MSKIRLDVDSLQVETFTTTPGEEEARGTVKANALPYPRTEELLSCFATECGEYTCDSCDYTCANTCWATCPNTCQATCPATCPATCQATCTCCCCVSCEGTCDLTCAGDSCDICTSYKYPCYL